MKNKIVAAGNTEIPAYLILLAHGYEVECMSESQWSASKNEGSFVACSPLELLGLVTLFETRGPHWQASDQEIEEFLARFQQ